jgi:hypothetical protein
MYQNLKVIHFHKETGLGAVISNIIKNQIALIEHFK